MGKVTLDISMSLDGFVTRPNDHVKQPFGEGGEILHDWLFSGEHPSKYSDFFRLSSQNKRVFDEFNDTVGAMLVGRRMFDMAKGWNGSHPIGSVPLFVVTHHVPENVSVGSTPFTFVTGGIESAVEQAKAAAGDQTVAVGSANVAQQCIKSGLLDEIQIHLVPVLFGGGIRLFDHIGLERHQLEKIKVVDAPNVTHLRYQILK